MTIHRFLSVWIWISLLMTMAKRIQMKRQFIFRSDGGLGAKMHENGNSILNSWILHSHHKCSPCWCGNVNRWNFENDYEKDNVKWKEIVGIMTKSTNKSQKKLWEWWWETQKRREQWHEIQRKVKINCENDYEKYKEKSKEVVRMETRNTKKSQKKLWEWWWSILISDSAVTAPQPSRPILTILSFVAFALIDLWWRGEWESLRKIAIMMALKWCCW